LFEWKVCDGLDDLRLEHSLMAGCVEY
jgi:hypothetical protein